jgi:proteasome assembly chaperone (PAC2) family protein
LGKKHLELSQNLNLSLFFTPQILDNEDIWFRIGENSNFYIGRFDGNGDLLQLIGIGSKTLNQKHEIVKLSIIDSSSFLIALEAGTSINGLGISEISHKDASIIKATTDPKVIWNIMFDYNNAIDQINDIK